MDEELRAEKLREAQNTETGEALETHEEESLSELRSSRPISTFWGLTFAFFMLIFFDIPQIILLFFGVGAILNYLIGFVGWLCIGIWLFLTGQPMWGARQGTNAFRRLVGNILGETFTAGFWPGFTVFIIVTMVKSKRA